MVGIGSAHVTNPPSERFFILDARSFSVAYPALSVSNWNEAIPDRAGRHRITKGDLDARAGLPNIAFKPVLELVPKRRKPPNDIEVQGFQVWFVSDRFKRLAEAEDPGAFEFVECDSSKLEFEGQPLKYWACGLERFGSYLNESLSEKVRMREERAGWRTFRPRRGTRISVDRAKLGDARVFGLVECLTAVFCDERFMHACQREELRGVTFTPV